MIIHVDIITMSQEIYVPPEITALIFSFNMSTREERTIMMTKFGKVISHEVSALPVRYRIRGWDKAPDGAKYTNILVDGVNCKSEHPPKHILANLEGLHIKVKGRCEAVIYDFDPLDMPKLTELSLDNGSWGTQYIDDEAFILKEYTSLKSLSLNNVIAYIHHSVCANLVHLKMDNVNAYRSNWYHRSDGFDVTDQIIDEKLFPKLRRLELKFLAIKTMPVHSDLRELGLYFVRLLHTTAIEQKQLKLERLTIHVRCPNIMAGIIRYTPDLKHFKLSYDTEPVKFVLPPVMNNIETISLNGIYCDFPNYPSLKRLSISQCNWRDIEWTK
jgi:hypothetical protein